MLETINKILLVEDDEIDRHFITLALDVAFPNLLIDEAATAETAQKFITENTYDCILLDYRLPDCCDTELLTNIVAGGISLAPVVMISRMQDKKVMLQCLKLGAQDYLLKDEINSDTLVRSISYATERALITRKLSNRAQLDPLTGLYNRSAFISLLNQAQIRAKRQNNIFSVMFLDLDHFKAINDNLGHKTGDRYLINVAEMLSEAVRQSDNIARIGGDEFAILLEDIKHEKDIIKAADSIVQRLNVHTNIDGHNLTVTASIGIANYPNGANTAEEVLHCADLAMYQAKKAGRNQYYFYNDKLQKSAKREKIIKESLPQALADSQLKIKYEVIAKTIDIHGDTTVAGAKVCPLLYHNQFGKISAQEYRPLAEKIGFGEKVDAWMLNTITTQVKKWKTKSKPNCVYLHIDVKTDQIRNDHFFKRITKLQKNLVNHNIQLILGVSENDLANNLVLIRDTLHILHGLGIQLSLCNFGMNDIPMKYLIDLPFCFLKIHHSITAQASKVEQDTITADNSLAIAKAFNLLAGAEGVQTLSEMQALSNKGYDFMEGPYFGEAVDSAHIADMIEQELNQLQPVSVA